jgi:uncharacterized Fe-S cluster-containing protein
MATFKNATVAIPDTNTNYSTLYTASNTTVIHAVYISNNSVGSNAEVVFEIVDNSATVNIPILDKVPLRANTTLVLEKPINLESGDSVRMKSNTGCPITAFASVMEV